MRSDSELSDGAVDATRSSFGASCKNTGPIRGAEK
jgi:hypothetical protein